jgi:hypothetical protein
LVVDRGDAGVLEPASQSRLFQETAGQIGALAGASQEHFDGKLPTEEGIDGAKNNTHTAAADFRLDATAAH